MPQRKFVAIEILVFDFELFIGDWCKKGRATNRKPIWSFFRIKPVTIGLKLDLTGFEKLQ